MNTHFRKITAMICMAGMAFALVSCDRILPSALDPAAETAGSALDPAAEMAGSASEEAGTSSAADGIMEADAGTALTPEQELPGSGNSEMLQLVVENTSLNHYNTEVYSTEYKIENSVIKLEEETAARYPGLQASLTVFENERKQYFETGREDLAASSESYFTAYPEELGGWYLYESCTPYVQRADSTVLSILYYYDSFTGGVHPNRAYGGENYDTATGAELGLDDVVTDVDAFAQKVDEKLREEYGDYYGDFLADPVQTVKDSVTQDGMMAWTLGYDGMTVYFSPYLLAAYVYGEQIITIRYDEAPELFAEKYLDVPDSYIIPLNDIVYPEVDADGSGVYRQVWITESDNDGYGWYDYTVFYGDRSCALGSYGYSKTAYLVKHDGRYYVYVITSEEDDNHSLYAVDLQTVSKVGEPEFLYETTTDWSYESVGQDYVYDRTERIPTDPEKFCLSSYVGLLSTMDGCRNYRVGTDGYPVSDDPYLTIQNTYVLKVRQTVSADIVDEAGNVTGTAVLDPGTCLFFVRTDGSAYADMQIVDASLVTGEETEYYSYYNTEEIQTPDWSENVYRFYVDNSDWPHKVNGIDESEVFSGCRYAG